jgi:hypothetical protein
MSLLRRSAALKLSRSKFVDSLQCLEIVSYVFGEGHNITVDVTAGYGLDGPASVPDSARFLSSPQCPDRFWGPPSLLSNGYRGLYLRGQSRQGREVVELHLHSPYAFMGWCLVN